MYNQLSLYYLKQMGIIPWIRKDSLTSEIRCVFLIGANHSTKELNLLDGLITALQLTEREYHILKIDEKNPPVELPQIMTYNVINFGQKIHQTFADGLQILFHDLSHYLKHPLEKKTIFSQLIGNPSF